MESASAYTDTLNAHVTAAMGAIALTALGLTLVVVFVAARRGRGGAGRFVWAPLAISPFALFLCDPPPLAPPLLAPPVGAEPVEIRARAQRWRWEFEQPNGMTEGALVVPARRPVHLVIESADGALHSFQVPALGIRAAVVPGRETHVRFMADREGRWGIGCGELCGSGHSRMLSELVAVPYDDWSNPLSCRGLLPPPDLDIVETGERLFESNGCPACHAIETDEVLVGPSLRDIAFRDRPLEDGVALADVEYLRAAILTPQRDVSRGFDHATMPAYHLPESQVDALVAYLLAASSQPEIRALSRKLYPAPY